MGRARKLKLLRRLAEQVTLGQPGVEYGEVRHTIHVPEHKQKTDGNGVKQTHYHQYQRVMTSKNARRMYKEMKKDNPVGASLKPKTGD